MQITSEVTAGVTIVTIEAARIDAAVAIRFKDLVREATEGAGLRAILDLHRVEFIDSSGLGAIVAAMKQRGGAEHLELAALAPNVEKVFRLTRMDQVFRIHADVAGAVAQNAG